MNTDELSDRELTIMFLKKFSELQRQTTKLRKLWMSKMKGSTTAKKKPSKKKINHRNPRIKEYNSWLNNSRTSVDSIRQKKK